MIHRALLCIAPLLAAPAFAQTTWYVDSAGTPPGTGTSADPYTSIQHAIDQATTVAGDTLSIAAGTYVENVLVDKALHLVGAASPELVTLVPAGPGTLLVSDADGCSYENLTFAGSDTDGLMNAFGNSITLEHCIFRDNARHGLFSDYDAFVDRCTFVDNGDRPTEAFFFAAIFASNSIMVGSPSPPSFGGGSAAAVLSDQFGGTAGPGTFVGDPRFWNAAAGDYRLRIGSDAIDSGVGAPDPDGSPADLGAYAYDPGHPAVPLPYCTATTNSQGCVPSIGSVGTPSASGAPFSITCAQVLNQKSGLLFYGYEPKATPYQGGYLCVQAPVKRTQLQNSGGNPPPDDCTGVYSYDFDARIQSGVDSALTAGASVYAQYWFRDSQSPGWPTGRSDGLYFLVGP